jgi:copper resistance protein C
MRMKRFALMFTVVAGLLVLLPAPALAHNSLVEAIPAKDARLAAPPAEVRLRFLSNLDENASLRVAASTDADAIGAVTVSGKIMSAPFIANASGTYTVTYGLTSSDGHVVNSSYTFKIVEQPAPTTPTVEQLKASATTVMAPPLEERKQDTPWFPYIGGAAVAGLAVGGLLAFLKRRREQQS